MEKEQKKKEEKLSLLGKEITGSGYSLITVSVYLIYFSSFSFFSEMFLE